MHACPVGKSDIVAQRDNVGVVQQSLIDKT